MTQAMATRTSGLARPEESVAQRSRSDEIQERYLRRAISEINELGDELLALGDELHVPVLGSGHPLGDVFLLKHRPTQSEIAEGVAFFGRAGQALLKSLQRLSRRPARDLRDELPQVRDGGARGREALAHPRAPHRPAEARRRDGLRDGRVPRRRSTSRSRTPLDVARPGEIQRFTPTIDALVTPDIDASLDEQDAKTRFWNAFKALGAWWAELPPY